jgi:glutamyl-Q tRNA(Asp) synthetase
VNVARSSSATGTTGTAEPAGGYCGRFAPSPTGPLHFGSLLAAVGSYLEARTRGGRWLVRIEDLDPPREQPGATERILADLDRFGFEWDGAVLRQSTRAADYDAALDRLRQLGLTLDCGCSRSQLAAMGRASHEQADELFHPAICPHPAAAGTGTVRLRVPDRVIEFDDRSLGPTRANVAQAVGPFVLRRRDGLHAYQLAVTVDDAEQGVTDVVRGADLLASTARQILLQEALGLPRPGYLHLPLAVNADGHKLSKSGDAPALDAAAPSVQLVAVLGALRQAPPAGLGRASAGEVWAWALGHWRPERFRSLMKIIPNEADTRTTGQEPVDDEQA